MTDADPDAQAEPPIGSIVTDNGAGWPWVRTAQGKWTRDACETFLTWDEVYAWHQEAVDDPDDDTTEPFRPVVMGAISVREYNAWRQGYYTGKRDYAGSITGGVPISTPNPYEEEISRG